MKYPLRFAAIAIASVSMAGTSLAGSSISTTGPGSYSRVSDRSSSSYTRQNTNDVGVSNSNRQTAMSGSVSSYSNTGGGYGSGNWGSYSPMSWQQNGSSYGQWWNGMMARMNQPGGNWNGGSDSWMPSGNNWQNDWNSWDPQMWQQSGSSYQNWYNQMMRHLMGNSGAWMNSWPVGNSGNLSSGSAMNANGTATSVILNNPSDGNMMSSSVGLNDNANIYQTGPGSSNVIDRRSDYRYQLSNVNDVNISNQNNQQAQSGDVNVGRNTVTGNASSGMASNTNSTNTLVQVGN